MPYLLYVGQVLPQGSTPSNLKLLHHNDFTEDMTNRLDLRGVPHKVNHIDNLVIGHIIKSFNYNSTKRIIGYIDMNTELGKYFGEKILKGEDFQDLSLRHNYDLLIYPKFNKEYKIITEVSSVKKGNRPGCKIIHTQKVDFDPKILFNRYIIYNHFYISNTSHRMEPAADPAAAKIETPEVPAEETIITKEVYESLAADVNNATKVIEAQKNELDKYKEQTKMYKDQLNSSYDKIKEQLNTFFTEEELKANGPTIDVLCKPSDDFLESTARANGVSLIMSNALLNKRKLKEQEDEIQLLKTKFSPSISPALKKMKTDDVPSAAPSLNEQSIRRFHEILGKKL